MTETIQRKLLVCARKRCLRCPEGSRTVPEDCPWMILHPLETKTCGTQERGRATGKTGELVEIANEFAAAGYPVYYITESVYMGRHTKDRFRPHQGIRFLGRGQVDRQMRGMAKGIVLVDEVREKDVAVIRDMLFGSGHQIVAHYWTPRP